MKSRLCTVRYRYLIRSNSYRYHYNIHRIPKGFFKFQLSKLAAVVQESMIYRAKCYIKQCWGAGAEGRGAKIALPPRAGAEITNCGSGSFLPFFLIKDLKKFYRKKIIVAKEFFVNDYPVPTVQF